MGEDQKNNKPVCDVIERGPQRLKPKVKEDDEYNKKIQSIL